MHIHTYMYVYVCMYIYIYIYVSVQHMIIKSLTALLVHFAVLLTGEDVLRYTLSQEGLQNLGVDCLTDF